MGSHLKVMLLVFLVLAVMQVTHAMDGAAYNYTGCGITGVSRVKRIVNGQDSAHKEWPWQVDYLGCGGTIVTENCIITAKHCMEGTKYETSTYDVYGGVYNRLYIGKDWNIQQRKAAETIMHPDYDIAVIRVDEPFDFSKGAVNAACLPTPGLTYAGQDGTATGFGHTTFKGESPDILQEVEYPIKADNDPMCRKGTMEHDLCAAHEEKGTCNADSGGPLAVQGADGKWSVVGVNSYSYSASQQSCINPDMFMRVTYFMDWIQTSCKGSGPILGAAEDTEPTCEDTGTFSEHCADWKSWGYCGYHVAQMNCQKTCNDCKA